MYIMTSIKSKTNAICLAICGMLPALLLSGCSELDEQPQGLEDISLPVSLQRSANDALRIAQSLRRQSSTRLNGPEDETTVAPILSTDLYPDSVLLETQMVDTVLYVVNFNSNGGFYLVSGDLRMTEVLGFSDTGSLDLDEGTADASVPMLRAMLSDYCLSITEDHPIPEPVPWEPPVTPVFPATPDSVAIWRVYISCSPWETVDSVPVLLPVEWNQGHPYNRELGNGQYSTGCVPLAVAQLLTYFRLPSGTPNFPFDWDLIVADSYTQSGNWVVYQAEVGELLRWVCEGLNAQFYAGSTIAYFADVPAFLSQQAGFSHPSSLKSYEWSKVLQSLEAGRPVLIRGNDGLYESGHAWVIDGYKLQKCVKTTRDTYWMTTVEETLWQTLVHCNWGGSNNGYFIEGIFDRYHYRDTVGDTDQEEYYRYGLTIIDNIYP